MIISRENFIVIKINVNFVDVRFTNTKIAEPVIPSYKNQSLIENSGPMSKMLETN